MNESVKWTNWMLKLLCVQVQSLSLFYSMNCVLSWQENCARSTSTSAWATRARTRGPASMASPATSASALRDSRVCNGFPRRREFRKHVNMTSIFIARLRLKGKDNSTVEITWCVKGKCALWQFRNLHMYKSPLSGGIHAAYCPPSTPF